MASEKKNDIVTATKHNQINRGLLLILSFGPMLDQFYHVSKFSRDPAPESTRLIMNIIFTLIYLSCFALFQKKMFWSKWISFSLYLLWFLISILVVMEKRAVPLDYLEIVTRAGILVYMVYSAKWIVKYKQSLKS